jgi:hypothetical protein
VANARLFAHQRTVETHNLQMKNFKRLTIFYRAFDVKHLKILDKIEEKVAGIEGITFSFFACLLACLLFLFSF